jgi:hypothetical protein
MDVTEIYDQNAKKLEDWDETQPEFINDPTQSDPPEGWHRSRRIGRTTSAKIGKRRRFRIRSAIMQGVRRI